MEPDSESSCQCHALAGASATHPGEDGTPHRGAKHDRNGVQLLAVAGRQYRQAPQRIGRLSRPDVHCHYRAAVV